MTKLSTKIILLALICSACGQSSQTSTIKRSVESNPSCKSPSQVKRVSGTFEVISAVSQGYVTVRDTSSGVCYLHVIHLANDGDTFLNFGFVFEGVLEGINDGEKSNYALLPHVYSNISPEK